jgi:hypothetical protein
MAIMPERDTRALDWRRLLPAVGQTTVRLRQLLLGGAIAGFGLLSLPRGAQAADVTHEAPVLSAPPVTIGERGKRAARLVLALPGLAKNLVAQHRSHSSHSSHRSHSSHYSGSSGTSVAPAPARPPAAAALAPELEPDTAIGVIEKIDRVKRTFSLKTTTGSREFSFRDDTQFDIVAGVTIRLDEYVEAHPTSFPVAVKDRVRIKWRTTTASQNYVATQVTPARP